MVNRNTLLGNLATMLFSIARPAERAFDLSNETQLQREARFEVHLRATHRQAYAFACRLTGNSNEAEDLVQETFVRACRFFHRYDPSYPFTGWLYRIMSNAHIDMVRRRGRLKTTSIDSTGFDGESAWDLPDESARPDRNLMSAQVDAALQAGLAGMNADFRAAVVLADIEGLAYEEVAEAMGTSIGTVRSRIHRGRKQLREYLRKKAPDLYARYAENSTFAAGEDEEEFE